MWFPEHATMGSLELFKRIHHQQPLIIFSIVLKRIPDKTKVLFHRFLLYLSIPLIFLIIMIKV